MQKAPVEVGEILAGKYRVERVLGVGGMGVVVAATHLHLDKMVALKFMLEAASQDSEVAARFSREAKAASRLRTQHITKVLDVGILDDGAPYMVMEFLDGLDLRRLMKKRRSAGQGPLPTIEAVDYILQACLGMAEAHSHGFVHRDLKPPNLFLTQGADGLALIKILDFGIAKASIDGIATNTQAILGSPLYMSPEQWEGARHVDERGDIWALGAILQYLLSGHPPFHGESMPVLFTNIATKEPRSLDIPELAVPPGLQVVVRRCLAKAPRDRPQSVAELASLLVPFGPENALEYADKAARVIGAGPGRSAVGEDPYHTPPASGVASPAEHLSAAARLTTDSNAGHRLAVSPEQAKPRTWLPLAGIAAIAIAAIAFGVAADQAEPGTEGAQIVAVDNLDLAPEPREETSGAESADSDSAGSSATSPDLEGVEDASVEDADTPDGRSEQKVAPSLQDLLEESKAAIKDTQYARGLKLCKEALDLEPKNQQAAMNCVVAACNLKDGAAAQMYLKEIESRSRKAGLSQICIRLDVEGFNEESKPVIRSNKSSKTIRDSADRRH